LLSWLAPEAIPRGLTACTKLAKQNAAHETLAQDGDVEEALAELAGFSMLKWQKGNQAFRIHRLVRDVIRERQPDERRSIILQSALSMVNNYLPGDPPPDDVRSWPIWEPMVAHVRELISEAVRLRISQPTSVLAMFIAEKSLWPEAEVLARLALEIDQQMLGPEHPRVAIRLNNLAGLLQAINRLTEAEPLMRRALGIDEKSYGPEHPDVARDLNNLAQLLQATNRLTEAEPLSRRQLARLSSRRCVGYILYD
jgi:tetratricopeptide (TPR) repeat protein